MSIDWGLSGAVILTGLVLVFVILLILIGTVVATSKFVRSTVQSAAAGTKSVTPSPVSAAAPVVQTGIDEETVAAIIAAISCMSSIASGTQYAIKSISRANGTRPVWGFAGMQQNTRPF